MKKIFFALITCSLLGCSSSKNNDSKYIFKGEYKSDINGLIPEGNSKVDIMGIKFPPGYEQLVMKFQQGIAANQEWFVTYQKENYVPGQGLPYHENFGITKEEYEIMKKNNGAVKLSKIAESEFLAEKNNEMITLSAHPDISAFNNIKIKLDSNLIYINNLKVPYIGISDIKDTNNVIGKWKGHRWKIEEFENPNYTSMADISGRIYEFTIGQSEKDKKTFMYIKKQIVQNGQNLENVDVQVFLK
ncbi:MAG TPA: hypothetical protein PKZ75_11915 [Bacteroidia bacterium]|nr:hypothetical protein [Bacteroidia bacterium]